MNTLERIYINLMSGKKYGDYMENVRFPFYWIVLYKHPHKNLFMWRHFGESANDATIENLEWIITRIFNMTPEELENKYTLLPAY